MTKDNIYDIITCVLCCFIVFAGFLAIDEKIRLIQTQIQSVLVSLPDKNIKCWDYPPQRDFNTRKSMKEWDKAVRNFIKFSEEQNAGFYMAGNKEETFMSIYLYKEVVND